MARVSGSHGGLAVVVGEQPPAMSVSFADTFFVVFYSRLQAESRRQGLDARPAGLLALPARGRRRQLAAGLDIAKVHGQADWNLEADEWIVPTDHWQDAE